MTSSDSPATPRLRQLQPFKCCGAVETIMNPIRIPSRAPSPFNQASNALTPWTAGSPMFPHFNGAQRSAGRHHFLVNHDKNIFSIIHFLAEYPTTISNLRRYIRAAVQQTPIQLYSPLQSPSYHTGMPQILGPAAERIYIHRFLPIYKKVSYRSSVNPPHVITPSVF